MKLVVLTLTHNILGHRGDVYKFFLRRMRRVCDTHQLEMVVVGDEGAPCQHMTEEGGFIYLNGPRKPVSDKWNIGMNHVKGMKPDYVMTLDSDDFLCDPLFSAYMNILKLGDYTQVGVGDSYFCSFHLKRAHFDKCFYWPGYKGGSVIMGCSRVVRSDVMDAVDWTPYPERKNASLNGHFHKNVARYYRGKAKKKVIKVLDGGYMHIDIKTNGNISSVAPLWKHRPLLNFNQLMSDHLPADEAEAMAEWREKKIQQYEKSRK